jgi:hypothetical protein
MVRHTLHGMDIIVVALPEGRHIIFRGSDYMVMVMVDGLSMCCGFSEIQSFDESGWKNGEGDREREVGRGGSLYLSLTPVLVLSVDGLARAFKKSW